MMNMFQLQERVKDFSKDQLVQEMQQPSGSVPPFLVLSELQRRTRMEQAFQAEQAQGQQPTVAQDAISAAGVPQGGIADMARAMAPQTDMGMNTGAAPMQPPPAAQPMMPVQGMYDGGVVRMQPGGLARNPQQDEIDEALARLDAAMSRAFGGRAALSEVSGDVGSFMPTALRAPSMGAEAGPLSSIAAEVGGARTAPGLPSIRPTDRQPILTESAPPSAREFDVNRAARRFEEQAITDLTGPSYLDFPPQEDLDLRFLQEQREMAEREAGRSRALDADLAQDTPASRLMDDIYRSRIARTFEAEGSVLPPAEAEPFDLFDYVRGGTKAGPAVDPFNPAVISARIERELQNPDLSVAERQALESQLAGVRRFYDTVQGAEGAVADAYALTGRVAGLGTERLGDLIAGLGFPSIGAPVIEFGQAVSGAMDPFAERGFIEGVPGDLGGGSPLAPRTPIVPLTPDADTPRPVPRPAGEVTPPTTPPTPPTGPQTGGGAGGSRGALAADRMLEQDKWLALAQFGLGLMASQAPSLGGAIGEAGTAALGQLGKARQAAVERDLAERTLAARTAGTGRDRGALTANEALRDIASQTQTLTLALNMARTPIEQTRLSDQLELLERQREAILAASGFGPGIAAAAEAGIDLNAER
jgi:hypothetical protein